MSLRHRLADLSYWVYDRSRHQHAFEAAAQPGTATDFSGLEGKKYALLVTFRKDGTAVPTPVWFGLDDGRLARAEAALDRHYGRTRRIYERVMTEQSEMVYIEVAPASARSA